MVNLKTWGSWCAFLYAEEAVTEIFPPPPPSYPRLDPETPPVPCSQACLVSRGPPPAETGAGLFQMNTLPSELSKLSSLNRDASAPTRLHIHEVAEFHIAGPAWVGSAHYQCARKSASTVAIPAIIEPVIAIAAGTAFGNSRLTTIATKIAATGRTTTK